LTPSVTKSFTTGPSADLIYPTVLGINPISQYRGVGTNVTPTIVFSKRMNPISLNTSTVLMYESATLQYVPIAVAVSADRMSVTLQPPAPLKPNTEYKFYLSGTTDLAGNAVAENSGDFVTGAGPDTTPPAITAMNPPNGSTTAINVTLLFYASKPISPLSFNGTTAVILTKGGTGIAGTATLGSDLQTITFVPKRNLTSSSSYAVAVSGFADLQGNTVTPFSAGFSTDNTGVTDTVQPVVLSSTPASSATNVAVNSTITLNFSKLIDPLTVNSATFQIIVLSTNAPIDGAYVTTEDNVNRVATVTFTPAGQMPGNATIRVSASNIQDYVGNNNQGYVFVFTTANTTDTTPPTVVSVTPANNAANAGLNTQVVITFSKAIDTSTVNANNFALFAGASRLSTSSTFSNDWRTVTLTAGTLPAGSTIQVTVSNGVRDLSGNALADFSSSFTTMPFADANNPSVTGMRPANGVSGVPLTAAVTLFLSKAMDPASTTAAVKVSQNGVLVSGTGVLSGNGQVLVFTPAAPFAANSVIQVFLTGAALDTFGNALNSYTGSFVTLPDPTGTAPVVTGTIPGQTNTNAVLNPVIEIQYNKPLDPTTVIAANAGLFIQFHNQPVAVNLSLRGDRTVRMTPVQPLLAATNYTYQVGTGLKDTTGLSPVNTYTQTFTTGTTTDTAQPRVLSVTPPDTSTAVGVNAPVHLHFSESLNLLTVSEGVGAAIRLTANGNDIGATSISFASAQDVTITPYQSFPDNTTVTLTATSGLEDPSGNQLVPFTSTFTTRTGSAFSYSNVTAASPADGTQSVPLNAHLQLTVDTAIDPTTVNGNSFALVDNATGATLTGTYSVSPDGHEVSFVPASTLPPSDSLSYSWNGNMFDINGNPLNDGGAGFTTSSTSSSTPPAVVATDPPNGYSNVPTNLLVQVLFSEPIQAFPLSGVTLAPSSGTALAVTVALSNANQTLTLVPPALLNPSTTYTLKIGGIVDIAGNPMGSTVTQTFTTGPGVVLIAPPVTSTTPSPGATGVPLTVAGTVISSVPVNPVSVTASTFYIYPQSTGVSVGGTSSVSPDGLTLTFTPSAALAPNTVYYLTWGGVTDLAGNTLPTFYLSFTTGN